MPGCPGQLLETVFLHLRLVRGRIRQVIMQPVSGIFNWNFIIRGRAQSAAQSSGACDLPGSGTGFTDVPRSFHSIPPCSRLFLALGTPIRSMVCPATTRSAPSAGPGSGGHIQQFIQRIGSVGDWNSRKRMRDMALTLWFLPPDRNSQGAHAFVTLGPDRMHFIRRDMNEIAGMDALGLILDLDDGVALKNEIVLVRIVVVGLALLPPPTSKSSISSGTSLVSSSIENFGTSVKTLTAWCIPTGSTVRLDQFPSFAPFARPKGRGTKRISASPPVRIS